MSDTAQVEVAPAEPTNEIAPAAAPVVEAPNSTKLLDIAKKEAAFVKKEVEYKSKLAEAEKQLSELQYFRNARNSYKDNPEELLSKLGIGYDELTNSVIDYYARKEKDTKPPSVEEVRKQVEEEFSKREAANANAAANAAIADFNKEINVFITANAGSYPHLTNVGSSLAKAESVDEIVFGVVSEYFEETGELLDLKTAADTAEEYFREEWNKLNGVLSKGNAPATEEQKVVSTPKVSAVAGSATPPAVEEPVSASRFKLKDLTITNNLRPHTSVPYRSKDTDRRDIIERAIATYDNVARQRTK